MQKDNQRAEYGGEEMQEISIQYWLEKKENETKEEVIGQKNILIKMIQALKKYFFKAPSSGEKQKWENSLDGHISWGVYGWTNRNQCLLKGLKNIIFVNNEENNRE